MKNFKKLLTCLLSLVLMITSVSYAHADEKETNSDYKKEETVYAFLDANGNFESATVSEWLHSDNGFNDIKDESILDDIKNLKGDEKIVKDGDTLTWNSDNTDIYYQGSTNKELPLSMQIIYYFNGNKVNIEDVIGQSGKLEIRIKLINNNEKTEVINGKTRHISTLFPCIILTDLKTDVFEDVKADGAIVVNESKNQLVSFVTVSGASELLKDSNITELDDIKDKLKDEFVISANVTNLEMPSIYCAISAMVDLDNDNLTANDLNELKTGINDLQNAMNEVLDGSDSLKSGANTLNDGVNSLKDGIKSAQSGANTLNDSSETLKAGSTQLNEGLKTLQSSLNGISNDSITSLVSGSAKVSNGLASVANGSLQLVEGYNTYKNALGDTDIETLANQSTQLSSALEQLSQMEGLSDEQKTYLNSAAALLAGDAQVMMGANSYIEQSYAGIDTLNTGLQTLNTSYAGINTGIQQIGSLMADPNSEAMKNLTTLKSGVDQLVAGSETLNEGITQYTSGVSSLKNGLDELSSGADKLSNGSKELLDGTESLDDGLNKFNNDGVNKLSTKVNDAISTLDDVVDVVNEVLDQSVEYNNYAGATSNAETSVKFIMKTKELAAPKENNEVVVEEETETTTFFQRLVNLFKK